MHLFQTDYVGKTSVSVNGKVLFLGPILIFNLTHTHPHICVKLAEKHFQNMFAGGAGVVFVAGVR